MDQTTTVELSGSTPGPQTVRSDAPAAWAVSKVVDERYVLEQRLGGGAMGDVFLARDGVLKRHVALKALRADLAENRTTVDRFRREVALAHAVTHPNVVRIYDAGEFEGLPYFTMEPLRGQPLDEIIRGGERQERLSIAEIRDICVEILEGLEAAHRVGVVHRDLKPGNVMLTHRGAIVMDFGVAAIEMVPDLTKDPTTTAELKSLVKTEAGTIFGSPAYMAPELWDGAAATVQSDLYSFGVLLYQMLSGRLPYEAPTPSAYLEKLRTIAPTPIRSVRRDTPWNMALLVRRCMAHDADRRPQSAAAAAALLSPLGGRRRQGWVVVLGAAAVTGMLAAAVSGWAPGNDALDDLDPAQQADLAGAVRSFDAGDWHAALGHLERLRGQQPKSAAGVFWEASTHARIHDETGRLRACQGVDGSRGTLTWRELAAAACGLTYRLSPAALATLEDEGLALGDEFLPLAIDHSLIPRLEALRGPDPTLLHDAELVRERLAREPVWRWWNALPTSWALAEVHLSLALGHVDEARDRANALARAPGAAPIVLETAAWLELHNGTLERARELAARLGASGHRVDTRLLLIEGKLAEAATRIAALNGDPLQSAAYELWCGYAYRFEVSTPPPPCRTLGPGLVRMLWSTSPDPDRDWAAMTLLEQTIVRRQRDINLGECGASARVGPLFGHASPPFEVYLPQLEIGAALCSQRPQDADLEQARRLASQTLAIAPEDPWVILLQAQIDEALGGFELARAKRLSVARRWENADADLPLVRRLRDKLGMSEPEDPGQDLGDE